MPDSPSSPAVRSQADRPRRVWQRMPERGWDAVGLAARLLVGIVWIVAGYLKSRDANEMVLSVRAYQLLPESLVWPVAAVLPYLEMAVGLLLVLGMVTRLASALSILLFIAFIIGISSAAARGLSIDCGCFGTGGEVAPGQTAYTSEILRDVGLLIVSVYLTIRPRSLLAIDGLARRGAAVDADE